jgi:hypothetical protein
VSESVNSQVRRYSAFLSYSQVDTPFVRKLHRWLEAYRLPSRLAKGGGRRLKPLFRDSDELAAAPDLTAAVRAALADADFLIVICSPRSAQSKWVGREIELFRHLHGDKRILTALIDGDNATSFHPALLRRPHGRATEPLAADFRPGMGGHRMAFLKLMAPLAGVGLDELIHRDGQRQTRRVAAVAVGALGGMTLLGGMTVIALNQRSAAVHERNRAQALVGAMSNDLRSEAQGTASLGYLGKMNQTAASYFKDRNLRQMPDKALQERAKLLQNMGEDDDKRGNLVAAKQELEEAHRTTAILLAKAPNDPQRIFDHAQSEYWVGFINWRNGNGATAKTHLDAYATLADRLVRIDATNDTWLMETAFAASNLGTLELRLQGRSAEAERQFRKALKIRQDIAQRRPEDKKLKRAIANALAWLADSQRLNGDLDGALITREAQRKVLADLIAISPNNLEIQNLVLAHDLAVARIEAAQGNFRQAIRQLETARQAEAMLVQSDPDNKDFAKQARMLDLFEVRTWLEMPARLRPSNAVVAAKLGDCRPPKPAVANDEIEDFCTVLEGRVKKLSGDEASAAASMTLARQRINARHDVLTPQWGINLAEEAGAIQVAAAGGDRR